MTNKAEKNGPEQVVYEGRIMQIVEQPMKIGDKDVVFERARRAPGTRLIIVRDRQILLSREYREELGDYDYRLPGGKVYDSLGEYQAALDEETDMAAAATRAAAREAREEAGIKSQDMELFYLSRSGATVEWDLYYFVVTEFVELEGQALEDGEDIETEWLDFETAKDYAVSGKMKEDRSIGVLLRYLLAQT